MKTDITLERNLEIYLEEGAKNSVNGPSQLQRICRISYSQACATIEYGINDGLLKQDNEKDWLHWIV